MSRYFPVLICCALALSGCARSDLGSKAASEVVKKSVENEAKRAKSSLGKVGKVRLVGELIGSDPRTGAPLWKLRAKQIETKEPGEDGLMPRRATLTGATVELYRVGKLESTFTAPLIEFSNGSAGLRLLMPNGVRASNAGTLAKGGVPIEARAPRGDVDVTKRIVALSGGATVVRGPVTVTGQTLRTQTDLARSIFNGHVQATSPQGLTRARSAIFAWKENKLSAQQVTFTRGEVTLSGDKLDADTAAQKGVLSGHVRAKNADSTAAAPAASFDWKANVISAATATFARAGATLKADAIRTDSKLQMGSAQNVTVSKDGATLRAQSADGFDGLAKLNGQGVTVVRAGAVLTAKSAQAQNWSQPTGTVSGQGVTVVRQGTTLRAPRARATNWSASGGTFSGEGGVTIANARGTGRADSAVWTGGATGTITARGNVEIRAQNTILRGAQGRSDATFQNATLTGDVRASLKNGSTLRAPKVEKRGEVVVASGGATALLKTPKSGDLTLRAARIETTVGGQTARASGNVTIKSAEGASASAPNATYNQTTGQITASGGVVYNDPARGIINNRGDSLQADLKLGRAVIHNARGQTSGNLFQGKKLFQ